jgi:hypothetical protein
LTGISFKTQIGYSNYLSQIFDSIDVTKYKWLIVTDDMVYPQNTQMSESIFDSDIVSGESFQNSLNKDDYQMIFVDLKAFSVGGEISNVETYHDFINSDCQLVLLCVDSMFFEIYCKEVDIIEKIRRNCIANQFENIKFIEPEDAARRSMIAF